MFLPLWILIHVILTGALRACVRACVHACVCVCARMHTLSRVLLFVTAWTVARQAPLSMGFSRQEYWSGLPFPPPGDLPNPGIKPMSLHLLHCRHVLYHCTSPSTFPPPKC